MVAKKTQILIAVSRPDNIQNTVADCRRMKSFAAGIKRALDNNPTWRLGAVIVLKGKDSKLGIPHWIHSTFETIGNAIIQQFQELLTVTEKQRERHFY